MRGFRRTYLLQVTVVTCGNELPCVFEVAIPRLFASVQCSSVLKPLGANIENGIRAVVVHVHDAVLI